MKLRIILTVLCGVLCIVGHLDAQETGGKENAVEENRHVEKDGGFSFVTPTGWTAREFPGQKFQILFAPAESGFASNINVVDEAYKGTLDNYVSATKDILPKAIKKYRLIKQEPFKTTAGLKSTKMVIEGEQQDRLLRQTFYLFQAPTKIYVVTCTTLAAGGEKLDDLFETSMKSFRFEKK